jgi:hypothetical protein
MEFGKRSAEVQTPTVSKEDEVPEDVSGEMMAVLGRDEDGTVPWSYNGGGKHLPSAEEEEGYGEFPPYPLDGNPPSFSPKHR